MSYDTAHTNLLDVSEVMIHWFESNNLKANPTNFQLIVFDGTKKQRSVIVKLLSVFSLITLSYSQNISLNYA